jgi:GDP-4-dehydro-6-deoxy-D-mannose reductase
VRDYLDVDDVVEAYLRLLDPTVGADIYNVASGVGTRLGDLLDKLLDLAGSRPSIERDPERYRPADCSVGDASRLRAATGWKPRVSIERMLERLLADWSRKINAS